jgi:hypothetical protein
MWAFLKMLVESKALFLKQSNIVTNVSFLAKSFLQKDFEL